MTSLLKNNNQNWPSNENKQETPIRKRTRATADQLSVLEDTFAINVSPNSKLRKQLAEQLEMSERSIQIWFQNRRAKVKHMQKRAQMQMHQASIRAQLYGQYGNYYPQNSRAQSVDAVQHYSSLMPPPPPPPPVNQFNPMFHPLSRQSMPPCDFGLNFPEYIHGPSLSPSPSLKPTLIPSVLSSTDPKSMVSTEEMWLSSSPDSITVDPSNLSKSNQEEPKDLYLSATALTIGTWHRLKMGETDLVCVYRPDTRIFAWHILDGGCHFKMEVSQDALSSIEYDENTGQVHFDISEPPLFYMESKDTKVWVQCSDFTEGKQASRFFRHTLKGVHHLKQELLALEQNHPETRRLIHFIEPLVQDMYWPTQDDSFTLLSLY
ncbi:hypothetical protein G6F56_007149 [Rhizopus delemar]|uniref:Homeobox domain-containing protein n=1 Tax=Rhizopus stolonifer TaxID=4846 RepID=A0A367IY09_RHIST|nr:hypothetical protein G6F56_007149 [Rhizopus delemar]RCH82583.1 hypothetical protein CU098_002426 [Rhizopus stolonifer]